MNRRLMSCFAVGVGLTMIGCSGGERIDIVSESHPLRADGTATLVEGDVLVLESHLVDGDGDRMDECVAATSTAPEAIEVRRVQGQCRTFVLSAKSPGQAKVSFQARSETADLTIEVTPAP